MNADMRVAQIEHWLESLQGSLHIVRPIHTEHLQKIHAEKRYTDMVAHLMHLMHLRLQMRVGYVNSGGLKNAPAWIAQPADMPAYGTRAFRETKVTMYLRKSFLEVAPFHTLVSAIGHELSHVILDSINHPLRRTEEAVDLTAMMLGLSDMFVAGSKYAHTVRAVEVDWQQEPLRALFSLLRPETESSYTSLGYLTPDEIVYAAKRIATHTR